MSSRKEKIDNSVLTLQRSKEWGVFAYGLKLPR